MVRRPHVDVEPVIGVPTDTDEEDGLGSPNSQSRAATTRRRSGRSLSTYASRCGGEGNS
jgi:hypothetical protein